MYIITDECCPATEEEHPEILSSSGSSLTSWLTPRQFYEKSREDPEIGVVMGWPLSAQTCNSTQVYVSTTVNKYKE